jgi:hypothetical protein
MVLRGRPFGNGVTRRLSAFAIRCSKHALPSTQPPLVAARDASTKPASSEGREKIHSDPVFHEMNKSERPDQHIRASAETGAMGCRILGLSGSRITV